MICELLKEKCGLMEEFKGEDSVKVTKVSSVKLRK